MQEKAHLLILAVVRLNVSESNLTLYIDPSLSSSSSSSKEKYKFNPNKKQSEVPVLQKSGQKTGPSKKQQNPPPDDNDDNWVENPDYVTCPCCTRRFQPQTAERHIPHCKSSKRAKLNYYQILNILLPMQWRKRRKSDKFKWRNLRNWTKRQTL